MSEQYIIYITSEPRPDPQAITAHMQGVIVFVCFFLFWGLSAILSPLIVFVPSAAFEHVPVAPNPAGIQMHWVGGEVPEWML